MATKNNTAAEATTEPEFVLTRVFRAPPALVYKAWTEPAHMVRWWGPHGMTTPVCEMDVRPGGAYRITMRAPDGVEYPIKGVFQKIVEPKLIVMTQDVSEHPGEWHDLVNPKRGKADSNPAGVLLTTVTFDEVKEGTKLTIRTVFKSAVVRDAMLKMGMTQGWSQSLDRLEALLVGGTGDTADREIVTIRTFDAPRELVWQAWTDPKHIVHWWGPTGFTNTIHEMDVRPGGAWKFIMHGPDGTDFKNEKVYLEVERPKRLVYYHVSSPRHHVTVTFDEQGGKTTIRMHMVFETAELREKIVKAFNAIEGARQTMARLADYLPKIGGEPEAVESAEPLVTRVFDAPRLLVFKAWTEAEHLARWWGPPGFSVRVAAFDLRPGGMFHYSMRSADGREMWAKFVYREILAPERIVFVNSFSDEGGGVTENPWMPGWPLEILNTLRLTERDGQTTLTIHSVPIQASEAQQKAFREARKAMRQGFAGTFNKLADYLAKM